MTFLKIMLCAEHDARRIEEFVPHVTRRQLDEKREPWKCGEALFGHVIDRIHSIKCDNRAVAEMTCKKFHIVDGRLIVKRSDYEVPGWECEFTNE